MSNSLVQKSLELFGYEKDSKQGKKRKLKRYRGVLDLIPTQHKVVSKRKKSDDNIVISRSSKITVHEAKKQLETKSDPTEENVQRLLILSNNRIDTKTTDTLLERALKKQRKSKPIKETQNESSAFTEADFIKFEKEFLGS
ncbi:uncharacterized protein LOC107264278 [Cephus cinctus]|uniref:Uncharacterized protein LOC107264278 n=1 Tax=Cephus cinctus TaxID=211228 RepID=A0AAJ7BJU1_CEPCN|nr:uncharacterized protein LOC107264278 [Cephus cinctus]XP_015587857.1 uncharacterized protein LOC107264278 [Cephus cinctus]